MSRHVRIHILLALAAVLWAPAPIGAQSQTPPCSAEEHRAFDFWEGTWEVRAGDQLAGHNTIRRVMNGCVLHEHYTTPSGYEGESLNMYDPSRGVWHQTWMDNGGLLLLIEGGIHGDTMVMQGATVDAQGSKSLQRISWSRVDGNPDRVRQHWETSTDGGKSWTTAFDGLYLRQSGS